VNAVEAVRAGDLDRLAALLAADPGLVHTRPDGQRTLLHVLADWPGNRAHGPETAAALVAAGADVNARFVGPHRETRCTGRRATTTCRSSTRSSTWARTSTPTVR